jgi:pyrimidine-nucleoside phosphorylase
MAVCLRGMSEEETLALTRALIASGETLDWSHLAKPAVDKHSTGGVGDKTSLVLAPLMAAAGLPFVKMSGRGLGHTGGTVDKLESIPGFRVELAPDELRAQVERIGCVLVSQGRALVPADRKLYALRDVTGTVESVPLIASSVMSKKLAAGAAAIVLDVKWGAGAFMPTREAARELAGAMVAIGLGAGRRVRAVLSGMDEPLGRCVGNALEVREAIDTLRGGKGTEPPHELRELVLLLGVQLLLLAGEETDASAARDRLEALLDGGAALARFRALVEAQGGDPRVVDDLDRLPAAPRVTRVEADAEGWLEPVNARLVAEAALVLGAGRRSREDRVNPAVGVRLRAKGGAHVQPGATLAEVHAADAETEAVARELLAQAFRIASARGGHAAPAPEIIGA